MNKYIVLSALTLVFSLTIGCQNCGYRTAHSSRYQTLVGTTRLASPQTSCRYNTCSAYNTCNTCDTQLLANNGQFYPNAYAQYPTPAQNGLYDQYAGQNVSASNSLLDGTQSAPSESPLRWRRVTEEEQQYANSSVDPTSAGIASALSAPAFGSPAPAPNFAPRYPNSSPRAARGVASALETPDYPAPPYPPRYPNSSPRAAMGVASALTPGRPMPGAPSQYPNQYPDQYPNQYPSQYPNSYPNSYPRTTAGMDSSVSVPNHPLPPQYSNSYPGSYSRSPMGMNPSETPGYGSSNADQMRWRHVTEEEQQYRSSQRGMAQNYTGYGEDQPLTVPVYQGGGEDAASTQADPTQAAPAQGYSSTPEIDPNALPMPEPPTGTF